MGGAWKAKTVIVAVLTLRTWIIPTHDLPHEFAGLMTHILSSEIPY